MLVKLRHCGGCGPNIGCHLCAPCDWGTSWWGLHPSSSSSSSSSCHWTSPSSTSSPCGACGSGTCHVRCGVGSSAKPLGHWCPGSQWLEPWSPSWVLSLWSCCLGCHCLLCCCWACHRSLWWVSWRTRGTPSCGCAGQRMTQRPASSTFHIHSWHCSALL